MTNTIGWEARILDPGGEPRVQNPRRVGMVQTDDKESIGTRAGTPRGAIGVVEVKGMKGRLAGGSRA